MRVEGGRGCDGGPMMKKRPMTFVHSTLYHGLNHFMSCPPKCCQRSTDSRSRWSLSVQVRPALPAVSCWRYACTTTALLMHESQRDLGLTNYVVYEKNPQLGGTWFSNTYPGMRTRTWACGLFLTPSSPKGARATSLRTTTSSRLSSTRTTASCSRRKRRSGNTLRVWRASTTVRVRIREPLTRLVQSPPRSATKWRSRASRGKTTFRCGVWLLARQRTAASRRRWPTL